MTNLLNRIRNQFINIQPPTPGIYHYISPQDDPRNYRLHLRIEPDHSGILIINASTILHLNQTAAEYAYYLIKNINQEDVGKIITKRYNIPPEQAQDDYQNIIDRIQILINTPDLDPITFLDFDRKQPFSGFIPAPYRLDCALTYQLPPSVDPQSAPLDRVKVELSTQDWIKIINKAHELGIPHLVFTGGEPTLRDDLLELLNLAESNNQVTGILTDGLCFTDQEFLNQVLMTGLDHLMMLFNPKNDDSWSALENLLKADLYVAIHLTLLDDNKDHVINLIDTLFQKGIKAISLSTSNPDREELLELTRNYVSDLNLELIWNLPVPYSACNPIAIETNQSEEREGAGRAWLYIEPDGDVLPSQGINKVLGNILTDGWDVIWQNARSQ